MHADLHLLETQITERDPEDVALREKIQRFEEEGGLRLVRKESQRSPLQLCFDFAGSA